MSFINEIDLGKYRLQKRTFSKDNIVGLNGSHTRDKSKPMVFLSHNHKEWNILQDTISFLKNEGVDIYVDWMDEKMPTYTDESTAIRLKEMIKSSDKFIFIATENAINSKWCNWELGLGDAAKYKNNIALLPVVKSNKDFKGFEYLKIYPFIEYENGFNQYLNGKRIIRGFYVKIFFDNYTKIKLIPLKRWLKKK